jgi:hypothetical protein
MVEIVILDIETENTGYDVMRDNKRILSVQTYNGNEGMIYYDGSETNGLSDAKKFLEIQIELGTKFVGFNVKNFDVRLIKEFMSIDIPNSQIVDIGELPKTKEIKQQMKKNWPRLVELCDFMKIECSHKNLMDDNSQKFKDLPDVIKLAKEGAEKTCKEKLWWTYDYAYNRALNSISGGMAIMNSFEEFVKSGGNIDTLFYKYAIGDVISEYLLYQKVK